MQRCDLPWRQISTQGEKDALLFGWKIGPFNLLIGLDGCVSV
jgi:hypothetical protein